MPDLHNFDNLRSHGQVFHRCIECEWPGYGVTLSEEERARHAGSHAKARAREVEKTKAEALVRAREAAAAKRREDNLAYGRRDA